LVRTSNNKAVLIDAGPSGARIADRLRQLGIDTLDLVVASHNHADHVGGMARVLESIVVRNYLENGIPQTSRTYELIISMLERRSIPTLRSVARRIDVGGGVTIQILPGPPDATSQNDASVGILLSYGSFRALFAGDAETAERDYWTKRDSLPPVQVLKVSHHGSSNGTDRRFLEQLRPCVAIISVGAKNAYGHPAQTVIAALDSIGSDVFRTDRFGSIEVLASPSGRVVISGTRLGRPRQRTAQTLDCSPRTHPTKFP
jgi:beta-lactamase superfamily II metal-dependent hydrolase